MKDCICLLASCKKALKAWRWLPLLALLAPSLSLAADAPILKIYHDADWRSNTEASEAIWRGMEVAFSEVDYTVNGVRIELVKKNHNQNVTRSLRNMKDFLADNQAIAVVAGQHSPPLISNRTFINENTIPVLVPWAAGGPITRYPSPGNSIFRLSVDDTKAGEVLVEHAFTSHKCDNPYLFLESTPWGNSNASSIKKALKTHAISAVGTKRFGRSMKSHSAKSLVVDAVNEGAECLILVAGSQEGAQIALAMSAIEESRRIPIISHWGITGGSFHEDVDAKTREKIDLSFIQTCFSLMNEPLAPLPVDVLSRLKTLYPETVKSPKDISSPVGFIHAYDLTKILIAALETIELSDDIGENRDNLRHSLEALESPITGLVKTYRRPFTQFNSDNLDAHEALGQDDICMGFYGPENEIFLYDKAG